MMLFPLIPDGIFHRALKLPSNLDRLLSRTVTQLSPCHLFLDSIPYSFKDLYSFFFWLDYSLCLYRLFSLFPEYVKCAIAEIFHF